MANFKRALRETEEKTERALSTAFGSKAGRSIKEIREFADELGDAGAPLRQFLDGGDPMPLRALLAGSPDVTVEALTFGARGTRGDTADASRTARLEEDMTSAV
jgi:hypothetical protein